MIDLSRLSPHERLAAEQAVLTMRALNKAADAAPQGKGFECLEKVITEEGFSHLLDMLASAISAREAAQKKGSAFNAARAVARRSSSRQTDAAS